MSDHAAALIAHTRTFGWPRLMSNWIFPRTAFTLTFAAWVSGTHGPRSVIGGIRENWNSYRQMECSCTTRQNEQDEERKSRFGGHREPIRVSWYKTLNNWFDRELQSNVRLLFQIASDFLSFFPPKPKLRTVPTGNRFRIYFYSVSMVSQFSSGGDCTRHERDLIRTPSRESIQLLPL